MSDLLLVLRSYAVLQLLGLAAWPSLSLALRTRGQGLQDGSLLISLGLSKSLGLVLISYLVWLMSFAGVPISATTVWITCGSLGFLGLWISKSYLATALKLLKKRRATILVAEALFLVVFLILAGIRALTPDATFTTDANGRVYDSLGSEKFTNLALLTGIHRQSHMPLLDSWLSGYPSNYYYFGHFQWATFGKMAGLSPRVVFTVGQAGTFALTALNSYMLGFLLTGRVPAGVLALFAIVFMGTPYGVMQLLLEGFTGFRFWDTSRIVEGTITSTGTEGPITEFPFFTFILGDFHAHGISFHTMLLAMTLGFFFPAAQVKAQNRPGNTIPIGVSVALLLSFLLAITAMTNMWDAPMLGLLVFVILTVRFLVSGRSQPAAARMAVWICVIIGAMALVFLAPYLRTFRLPVGTARDPGAFYIGPLKWLGESHLSEFKDYMMHFGFLAIPVVLAIHARLIFHIKGMKILKQRGWANSFGASYLVALLVFLFAQRYFLLLFLGAMICSALVLLRMETRNWEDRVIILTSEAGGNLVPEHRLYAAIAGLAAVGFFLSLFVELWVIEDSYVGPYERYNTVFKAYNVIWLLYGICFAGCTSAFLSQVAETWKSPKRRQTVWIWAGLLGFLIAGAIYPVAATGVRVHRHARRLSSERRDRLPAGSVFDATRYYASVNPDEYRLLELIDSHVAGRPVVAEGCRLRKVSYTLQSRIATFAGVRTVLAWPPHESNWRGVVDSSFHPGQAVWIEDEMRQRTEDLHALYTSADEAMIRQILSRYQIEYIIIGDWERALYGPAAGATLATIFRPVYESRRAILLSANW